MIRRLLVAALVSTAALTSGPAKAGHSVLLAQSALLVAQGTAIEGRIVSASTGAPLVSARIEPGPVFTDREGRFALAAAADRITITKPGYLPVTVAIDAQAPEIALTKAGAIAGRITDAYGDPARGRTVIAERSSGNGADRRILATTTTDDLGEYRLGGLPEGRYFVGTRAERPPAPGRERPPQVYYPGAQSPPQTIAVATGEERWAIDVMLPEEPITPPGNLAPARRAAAQGTIRGTVAAADGLAVVNASVRLQVERSETAGPVRVGARQAVTDRQGRFEFTGVADGTYYVTVSKTGFITTEYGQQRPGEAGEPIALRGRETLGAIDVRLPRSGAITGRVVDALGEPVERANIRVMRIRYVGGARRLVDVTGGRFFVTDDRGVFRVYDLAPDAYVIAAAVGQLTRRTIAGVGVGMTAATVDLPGYTTTFYPGTGSPAEALTVAVGAGGDVGGIDIGLMRAPTARVAGRVVDEAGNPQTAGLVLAPSRRSGVIATAPVAAAIDEEGHFEFANVAPGEYVIQASVGGRGPFDEGESAAQFVVVSGEDVTGLLVRLSRGSSIRGRIVVDGTIGPGDGLFGVDLQALPVDMDLTPQNLETGPASAQIEGDGSFVLEGMSGPRVIRLQSPRWALKSVTVNGVDVTDTPMMFGMAAQSIEGVEVVLTDRVGIMTGRASDVRGRPVPSARIIVFATDRTKWGETSRFMGSTTAGRDGTFTLRNVLPGEYYAVAVTGVDADQWRDPELLDTLAPLATRLVVADAGPVTITLQVR